MDLGDFVAKVGDYVSDAIMITSAAEPGAAAPRILWCNPAFERLSGYTCEELQGQPNDLLYAAATDRKIIDRNRDALNAGTPVTAEMTARRKDGMPFHVEMTAQPATGADGTLFYVLTIHDVTDRAERERALEARNTALRESERLLQQEKLELAGIAAVATHAQDLITITDLEFRILWANPAFVERVGYPLSSIRGASHCDLVFKSGEAYASRQAAIRAILDGDYRPGEARNIDRDGNEYWTDVRVSLQRDDAGRPSRFVVVERDITEQRRQRIALERSRRDIEWNARHDQLTGLPNRFGLDDWLTNHASDLAQTHQGLALLHVDLDRFQQINDTLGHAAGDTVLREIARRLEARLCPQATAARIGGDEFVVALALSSPDQDVGLFAERLRAALANPVAHERVELRVGVSIGYVEQRTLPYDPARLLIDADIALHRAKSSGRGRVQAFTDALAREVRTRKTLSDELVVALEKDEFTAFYQPQIDACTGALAGVEALTRWRHPRLGVLPPSRFLSLARELDLEAEIDRRMMEIAISDLARLREAGVDLPKVSVNVSSRRLHEPGLVNQIAQLAPKPGELSVELLESTFLDERDEKVVWTLDALREHGVGIEIDDFGTGHASVLGLLRVLPDRLKLDRSLTDLAMREDRYRSLFGHMVAIGASQGIAVTAEGIESEAHAEMARSLGCDVLQGYLFGAPNDIETLIAALGTRQATAC